MLVAALSGAFGRATRETFQGKGKLDFFLPLSEVGADGLIIAYGGELKIWDGEQVFLDAVDQELENCTSNTRDGVLITIVRNRESFSDAQETALAAMRERFDESDRIAGQPAFLVPRPSDPNHQVRLVVMFVDETRTEEHLAKQPGAKER